MERLIEAIKSVPRAEGFEEIFYPGEPEAVADERNRKRGVVVPDDTLAELDAGARELGIATLDDMAGQAIRADPRAATDDEMR
jgi:LDH2 family malate/lactate/ureidoglycolate dehydrogenase